MLRPIYYDDGSIVYGGKFTDGSDAIEVINLDSAAGVDGCVLVQIGSPYVTEDRIRSGAKCCGVDDVALIDSVVRACTYAGRNIYASDVLSEIEKRFGPRTVNKCLMGIEWVMSYAGMDIDRSILFVPMRDPVYKYSKATGESLADEWRAEFRPVYGDMNRVIKNWLMRQDVEF